MRKHRFWNALAIYSVWKSQASSSKTFFFFCSPSHRKYFCHSVTVICNLHSSPPSFLPALSLSLSLSLPRSRSQGGKKVIAQMISQSSVAIATSSCNWDRHAFRTRERSTISVCWRAEALCIYFQASLHEAPCCLLYPDRSLLNDWIWSTLFIRFLTVFPILPPISFFFFLFYPRGFFVFWYIYFLQIMYLISFNILIHALIHQDSTYFMYWFFIFFHI